MFAEHVTTTSAMTHFWLTPAENTTLVKYYIDGESEASIQIYPYLACGTGFNDDTAEPWGIKYFGKGAKTGAWTWNFKIPFQKSIRITMQAQNLFVLYTIFRGGINLPLQIGGVDIPKTAKMVQTRINQVYERMDFVPIVNITSGSGMFFMHTLAVRSNNLNFLEGCYHLFSPINQPWPGTVLSTGTEDFFDSAYYFNGGEFRLPVSGLTHLNAVANDTTFSAYRFHEQDPILFDNGLLIKWRNGDMTDRSGIKCLIESGGHVNGDPRDSHVMMYSWTYTW